jgi:hypothetical protein
MKLFIKKSIYSALLFLVSLSALAQDVRPEAEMADRLRADGKIYVVVAIILIILVGFIAYLMTLDRKIKKLENLLSEKHTPRK